VSDEQWGECDQRDIVPEEGSKRRHNRDAKAIRPSVCAAALPLYGRTFTELREARGSCLGGSY